MSDLRARFQELSVEIGKHLGYPTSPDEDGAFAIEVPAAEGRKQWVKLALDKDRLGNPLIMLSSKCGSVEHVDPRTALQINGQMPYGALGIVGDTMVLRAGCYVGQGAVSIPEIIALIKHVAAYADRVERGLYGDVDLF
ncbi:MAG TPA: hypothetical protein VKN99_21095 [Polyangia bacterium]|nr:hypothetical protein [Polyangia bacterium]